jgi:acyl-[acyl-carrier-protein]-phospholipid O-acyltransferase/long-chain-fatty-acid--[acyl-carrier-protein] ligase
MLWVPGIALIVIAALGLTAALFIPRLESRDPDLKFSLNPFGTYIESVRDMARSPLLNVAMAWSFFYMVGMMALLILPDYKALLDIDPKQASYLLGILGVAIGLGSVSAGWISGHHIEPRLIPIGAIGMTVGFTLLGLLPLKYILVASLLFGAGFFAGFYIIPLQSLLQYLSPLDERGRFLGTANAMSFVASTVGTLIFLMSRRTFSLDANRIFLVCAGLSIVGTGVLMWQMRRLIADPSLRRVSSMETAETGSDPT